MEGQATGRADAGCERAGVVGAERAPGLGAGRAQRPAAGRGPGAARGRAALSRGYAGADVHAGGRFTWLTSTAYGRTRLLPAADQASASPSSPAKRARADPVDPQRAALELHSQRTLKAMLQYVHSSSAQAQRPARFTQPRIRAVPVLPAEQTTSSRPGPSRSSWTASSSASGAAAASPCAPCAGTSRALPCVTGPTPHDEAMHHRTCPCALLAGRRTCASRSRRLASAAMSARATLTTASTAPARSAPPPTASRGSPGRSSRAQPPLPPPTSSSRPPTLESMCTDERCWTQRGRAGRGRAYEAGEAR